MYVDGVVHQTQEGAFGDGDGTAVAGDVHPVVPAVCHFPADFCVGHEMDTAVGQILIELGQTAEPAAGIYGDVCKGDVLALFGEEPGVYSGVVPQNEHIAQIGGGRVVRVDAVNRISEGLYGFRHKVVSGSAGDAPVVAVELDLALAVQGIPFVSACVKLDPAVNEPMRVQVGIDVHIGISFPEAHNGAFCHQGLFPVDDEILHTDMAAGIHGHRLHLPGEIQSGAVPGEEDVFHILQPESQHPVRHHVGVGDPVVGVHFFVGGKIIIGIFKNKFRISWELPEQLIQSKGAVGFRNDAVVFYVNGGHSRLLIGGFSS